MVKLRTPDTPAGEEAQEVQQILFPYGIGIDTHSKFIQVCVLIQTHHKGGGGSRAMRRRLRRIGPR